MVKASGGKKREEADKADKDTQAEENAGAAAVPAGDIPRIRVLAPIARPLAEDKLKKKVLKLAKKATQRKSTKRGVKEVVKAIRKQQDG